MAEFSHFSKLARPLQWFVHRQDGPADMFKKGNFMFQVSSSNRIVAGFSAFALTMFVIAASFAPQGAFVSGFVA